VRTHGLGAGESPDVTDPIYNRIGLTYTSTRRPDPRIAAAIRAALGDARTVLNVGAGAGAYEPTDLAVIAVEPSAVMIAQRSADAAPVIQASAEELPFDDASFDAVMASLSDHHWSDRAAGLRELSRVARHRVVIFNADPAEHELFWMNGYYMPWFGNYVPARYLEPGLWRDELAELLGGALSFIPVPIPHDCSDGFYCAYWRRPEAYLDPVMRDGISVFHKAPPEAVAQAVTRLGDDLASGAWQARHRDLLNREELHLGYYLVVAESSD
jgi:SAM-dependent methyltransferase